MRTDPHSKRPPSGSGDGASPRRLPRLEAAGIGAGVGLALTFPAIGLAILSSGAGHGSLLVARVLFPFPLLAAAITGGALGIPALVLAVFQMPIEGALVGAALAARRPLGAFLAVSAHLLAVALCASVGVAP